ncbi:MAG: glucose-6-phosphate isomerase [Micrococcus sp.]|nr:glucose-6-phosphate isomerase [Micrococcus sp.]
MSTLSLITHGAAADAVTAHVPQLVEDRFASRLFAQDATLWGDEAQDEASIRLGWVEATAVSRPLVESIEALAEQLRAEGVRTVILAGMGGSSLAPEVITATAGVELTVLDSTDPQQVRAALGDRVAEAVLVVASKSGSTVETDSQRRAAEEAFRAAGMDPRQRIVVVTDPGSPLDEAAREAGYRAVFTADPHVGGRYSALTAFGLVPSGLAGVDLVGLLDDAESVIDVLALDEADNPGLQLGAALAGTQPLRDKLIIQDLGSGIVGFGDWAEQLVAESTGKHGRGLLPVVVEADAPETTSDAADVLQVVLTAETDDEAAVPEHGVLLAGSLGAQLLLWEVATAVAGRLLEINPFDQPDVEAAKVAARALLQGEAPAEVASVPVGPVQVAGLPQGVEASSLSEVLEVLLGQVGEDGYVAVQAYLDRLGDRRLEQLRPALARRSGRPVTFGWGPRFLHSTGQLHKGGPRTGVFLQLVTDDAEDLPVPGRAFSFGTLIAAQAAGDAEVLRGHGLTVITVQLPQREAGIEALLEAAGAL